MTLPECLLTYCPQPGWVVQLKQMYPEFVALFLVLTSVDDGCVFTVRVYEDDEESPNLDKRGRLAVVGAVVYEGGMADREVGNVHFTIVPMPANDTDEDKQLCRTACQHFIPEQMARLAPDAVMIGVNFKHD